MVTLTCQIILNTMFGEYPYSKITCSMDKTPNMNVTSLPWKHMIKTDCSMNAAESNVHQNTSWFNKSLHLKIIENWRASFIDAPQVDVTSVIKCL